MKKNCIFLGIFALFICASCSSMRGSSGGDSSSRADRIMSKLDKDNDDKISRSEIKFPMTEKIFDENDANKNGFLEKSEILDYMEKRQ